MKTFFIKRNKAVLKISGFLLIFLFAFDVNAQVDPEESDPVTDTIKGYNRGKIEIQNPPSIVSAYTYDPITDRYIYNSKVGEFNITYPAILTPKEYEALVLKESMRKYFQEKANAIDGKRAGSEDAKKDLLPRYYVNNSFFETVFGSNTIDVKPTGSAELDLGLRYTKQDNPSFSPRNRAVTTFDFDQRISLSLLGKVGTRLNVNVNYDTESTFAFQNLIKLEYTPTEDDILQKIEVGNVSLPLNSSLIRGAQSLFGVKTQLQFGKTTVTAIFSEQKSQTKSVTAQGGGTVQEFDLFALDYDADRHFFLSQYFRNLYDRSLKNYPVIDSRVQITRMEVWVTNRQNRVSTTDNNLRNIVALQDLGEARITGLEDFQVVNLGPTLPGNFFVNPTNSPVDNKNNRFDPALIATGGGFLNQSIRQIETTSKASFNVGAAVVFEGQDFAKLENARKLSSNEYSFHPQLGYISLQQRLANDEVLAVAYQYTIGSEVYQVGEFANGGPESTTVVGNEPETQVIQTNSLILKMLKSSLTTVQSTVGGVTITRPIWNLMMKNIYQISPGGQLEQEDFQFNILYSDPSPLNYITQATGSIIQPPLPLPADVAETPLLKVFNLDALNYTNDPENNRKGDGFFDFIPGLTVDTQNGRIIFTTVEPFGSHLFKKLAKENAPFEDYDDPLTYNANQAKYVFRTLYTNSQAKALQDSEKNKFQLRGKYKSTGADGISLNAFNVPQGSVTVTAGGRILVEGIDYIVNYQRGTVQILDPALQASNTPIEVSLENNSVFGQQTRRFFGVNVEHKFSEKFFLGGTILRMSEQPFTQKSSFGQESVNNTIFGLNTNYSTEVPFLTRMVNKLPNLDTDVPSNLSVRGEVAFLKPDAPKADQFNGESTIYVDDFEGSQTSIDMRAASAWSLSSVPSRKGNSNPEFFGDYLGTIGGAEPLKYGYRRAKMSWYTVDPIFYTGQRPDGITDADMSFNKTRRIYLDELFPVTDVPDGQSTVINTLDLSYYPTERGPYNFNPTANGNTLANPEENFGGIMRSISSTNFEQGNVEYIQFWMLNPYENNETPISNGGKLFFNLGEISEDILKDGKKQYENGLPEAGSLQNTSPSIWGRIPSSQSLIYAFDTNNANRAVQDVGLDGIDDAAEALLPGAENFAGLSDPAADNYEFYLDATGNLLDRYKNYNGLEKNSPVEVTNNTRGNSSLPDVEDLNRDNTMNTIDAYYQYSIDVSPGALLTVGQNYITDIRDTDGRVPGGAGASIDAKWIQFKIPIQDVNDSNTIGPLEDFKSIRFMRMFMTGFSSEITLRFATLDLVRGEWRRYTNSPETGIPLPSPDPTSLDVLAVNIQENSDRVPIQYVTPPGVNREQLYNNNTVINQNEQSLALRVAGAQGLGPDESRAIFKNISIDMRQYKSLKMFMHAESFVNELVNPEEALNDDEMAAFFRFGNDFTQNYYEVELPLKVTKQNDASTAEKIWPAENNLDLPLDLLTEMKILAMNAGAEEFNNEGVFTKFDYQIDPNIDAANSRLKISIKGNPNFGQVRTLMVGVRNNTGKVPQELPRKSLKGEVWFNELRLAGMDNEGGMAAILSLDTNFADFATISATGRMSTIGFGALEDGPNERSREDMQQYNIVTNLNLGKLLPKKWGINVPFNFSTGEEIITPEYDPFNQDIKLQQLIDVTNDQAKKDNIKDRAIEYTKTKSINFIGVRKDRGAEQKPHVYDPENFTFNYSFNEIKRHDYEIEDYVDQQVRSGVDYNYTFQSKLVEPLKETAFMKKSNYWKLLSDFNFNYLPSNINFSTNILRQYNRQQFRQVEVEGIPLDALYRRNYLFNYQYGFNYNLTKSLKLNYTAATSNIVRNYLDDDGNTLDNFNIWQDYWNFGEANTHNQQLVVNYELPLSKVPFLSFVKATYTYTGDFNWQRASLAESRFEFENPDGSFQFYNLGNTIQNNGAHRLNTALNMDLLYKYVGLTKSSARKPAVRSGAQAPPKPGERINNRREAATGGGNVFLDGLIGVVTSIKNIQINYAETGGTVLPGYIPGIGVFGTTKPGLGFVFGDQSDIRYDMAQSGYLTNFPNFNQNYTEVVTRNLDLTANVDLFPDFKIDLVANRSYIDNFSEQFDVMDGQYMSRSPYNSGNFAISTLMIGTAFGKSDENGSAAFNDFRGNRLIVADRLAANYYGGATFTRDAEGYPTGFGKNSQAVLLPSFLAAYTGTDAGGVSLSAFRNIPIPNWTIQYTGLMRYAFFKENFKRFSVRHAYKASYTVNSFRSNFDYDIDPNLPDQAGNLPNKLLISNVNLVEQFNPLIKFEMEMKNSVKVVAELKKDRALSMSFDNNLLTEVQGLDYVLGLGYRIKDVVFNSALADNPTGVIKSDINIKADFSFRQSQTIVRYLDYDNNQLAGGQNLWSVKLTADYSFSKNLTAIFFYDHAFSKAVISTAFPITTIRTGFTMRYNFGN
ncbi:cell surface protein SprA [Flavobacterium tegetincola]|uniref:T9SS outer membrane translocon Sov/SprA n=1 Tax=Flavobacterium tegetincola TaxID=150172 RepID=UPI000420F938|nr:cell surface protein SprA [Flavobacterium tegetincola]